MEKLRTEFFKVYSLPFNIKSRHFIVYLYKNIKPTLRNLSSGQNNLDALGNNYFQSSLRFYRKIFIVYLSTPVYPFVQRHWLHLERRRKHQLLLEDICFLSIRASYVIQINIFSLGF
jgi:hypothetical protein